MTKFFKQIRHKLLSENKFSKYLIYAIGEIVLVVIGILIAVSISNWNENLKSQNELINIYEEISINLKSDLRNIESDIKNLEKLEIILKTIISNESSTVLLDTINATNFSKCVPCNAPIASYVEFEFQDKGLVLLKNYNDYNSMANKKLSAEIIQFYKSAENLYTISDKLKEETFNNLKYFEQFPWYSDFIEKKYNPQLIEFLMKNEIYRNKVISFGVIAIDNYLPSLREYEKYAVILLDKLEKVE